MKQLLLDSAEKLSQVSIQASNEYEAKADFITNMINTKILERSDLEELIGKTNLDMMRDNHANHVRFILSILKNKNSIVLVDTVLWVFRAYRSHGFTTNYWAAQINGWIEILKESFTPESYKEIYPYYEWLQINIPLFVLVSDEKLDSANSLH